MINVASLLDRIDLVDVIERNGVVLRKAGSEWVGLCPFHDESSPSFYVTPVKGFAHCFGCGWNGNAISFLMLRNEYTFIEACHKLGGHDSGADAKRATFTAPRRLDRPVGDVWVPIYPVPHDVAPPWLVGVPGRVWNIKKSRWWERLVPERVDAYRSAEGAIMGYVLRTSIKDEKITPTVTWCIGPNGEAQWCLQPFPGPRPLCGLDELAARPNAPVLVVEGEKCKYVAAEVLPQYVVITWPGGSHGIRHADWSALSGRDVVLWRDADEPGVQAMLGYEDRSGALHEGVAQHAFRAGCASLRMVDPTGMPKGWDIADAVRDRWTPRQIAAWAKSRVCPIEIEKTESIAV